MKKGCYSKNIPLLSLCLSFYLYGACGKESKTTAPNAAPDASTEKTIDDPTQPGTVALSTGASLDIPAGALGKGAKVTLGVSAAPADFAASTSGDNSAASSAFQVSMKDANGANIVASSSIILTIPYSSTSSLTLAAVDKVAANLIALAKGDDGKLLYWSKSMMASVDEASKTVKLPILQGGIYQLAFASQTAAPSGFTNFAASTADLSKIACAAGQTNIYSKIGNNASFKTFLDLETRCICTLASKTTSDCSSLLATAFNALVCYPDAIAGQVDDAAITKAYDAATTSLKTTCDGTKNAAGTSTSGTTGTSTTASTGTSTAASTGSLDGTWLITGYTCNGKPFTLPGVTNSLTVLGTTAISKQTTNVDSNKCTQEQNGTLTFPSTGNLTSQFKAGVCTPITGGSCTDPCAPADAAPVTATYTISDKTLTTTQAGFGGCSSGTLVYTYTKQ